MYETHLAPWLPARDPDLARLAMAAADAAGLENLSAWPEWRKGGIGFGPLPAFLAWHGILDGRHHLVLVQPREIGALVPGARLGTLPSDWLEGLDMEALGRPLAIHPDFSGAVSVHVVHVPGPGQARIRTWGESAPALVASVLEQLSGIHEWNQGKV